MNLVCEPGPIKLIMLLSIPQKSHPSCSIICSYYLKNSNKLFKLSNNTFVTDCTKFCKVIVLLEYFDLFYVMLIVTQFAKTRLNSTFLGIHFIAQMCSKH